MQRTFVLIPLMAVATACGPMTEEEVQGEVVVEEREIFVTNARGEPFDEQEEPGTWDDQGPAWDEDDVDDWGWEPMGLSELSSSLTGHVGEHFVSAGEGADARTFGDYFAPEEDWQSLFVDTRVDVSNGETAMLMVMVDGDLMNGVLEEGITVQGEDDFFLGDEPGDGEIFASVRACTGPDNDWDIDIPADEAEIDMTTDDEDPGVVILNVSATFTNPDTGLSEQAKARFSMRLDG
jgi:hypothetical protein